MGFNVRAVGLADYPKWRAFYYVACMAIGAANVVRPSWSAALGVLESGINILLSGTVGISQFHRAQAALRRSP